jgi:hypothetical protein
MPKKSSKPNKSDFVRGQPAELSAAQVVAKAKEAGLNITPALVYTVRSSLKVKGAPEATPAPAAAKPASDKGTASEFIRSLPTSVSANEAAAQGAAQGYSFQAGLVYKVRRAMQGPKTKAPKAAPEAKVAPAPAAHPAAPAASSHSGNLAEFRKLMIQIGLDQAEALFNEVHRQMTAIADKA